MKKILFLLLVVCLPLFGQDMTNMTTGLKIVRLGMNHYMVQKGAANTPYWLGSDGMYLGGTWASFNLEALVLGMSSSGQEKKYGKVVFVAASAFTFFNGGLNDARMWSDPADLRGWQSKSSGFYYVGSLLEAVGPTLAMRYWQPSSRLDAFCTTTAANLIGGTIWDMVFGHVRYDDPWYPFPNWYGGVGFPTRRSRIGFDLIRLGLGTALLFLPDVISGNEKVEMLAETIRVETGQGGMSLNLQINF